MCKFQEEINSKIQEKKNLNIQADIQTDSLEACCPPASTEGQSSVPGLSCDRGPEEMHPLADASGGPDDNDDDNESLGESWSNAEAPCQCGVQSVGSPRVHDLWSNNMVSTALGKTFLELIVLTPLLVLKP